VNDDELTKTNMHALSGIRDHGLSVQGLHLRPHCHLDRNATREKTLDHPVVLVDRELFTLPGYHAPHINSVTMKANNVVSHPIGNTWPCRAARQINIHYIC
jgi:hypothetical protein